MNSKLEAMYRQLQDTQLTLNSRAVRVISIDEPISFLNGPYPVRIPNGFGTATDGLRSSGNWNTTIHNIAEFLALGPTAQGMVTNTMMIRAKAAYDELVYAFRNLGKEGDPTIRGEMRGVRITPGASEWPPLSGNMYYGVWLSIDVEEFLI